MTGADGSVDEQKAGSPNEEALPTTKWTGLLRDPVVAYKLFKCLSSS